MSQLILIQRILVWRSTVKGVCFRYAPVAQELAAREGLRGQHHELLVVEVPAVGPQSAGVCGIGGYDTTGNVVQDTVVNM